MPRPVDQRFSMENGTESLNSALSSLSVWTAFSSCLVVTDADAVAEYVASVADRDYELQVDVPWSTVTSRVYDLAREAMATDGELRFSTDAGAFACR